MFTVLVAQNGYLRNERISHMLNLHFRDEIFVRELKSGREFFSILENEHSDIIIWDSSLPDISGSDLINFLHGINRRSIILPIVDFSLVDPNLIPDDPHILDYLITPWSETELILTFEEAMRVCRLLNRESHPSLISSRNELSRIDLVRKKIDLYIQEHYGEAISMQDAAKAMNYSDTHFCRLFKQCFQVNFSTYLNDFRVSKAQQLLTGSNLTVKDVGCSCGFRDASYFIRVFKRHTGMTPSDYRIHKLTMTAKKSNKS